MHRFALIGLHLRSSGKSCRITAMAALLLAGCSTPATDAMPAAEHSTGRVKVERIGVIGDSVAYQNRRGIYLVTDTKTGTEYIGVSGVGITETGTHPCGKGCVRRDER